MRSLYGGAPAGRVSKDALRSRSTNDMAPTIRAGLLGQSRIEGGSLPAPDGRGVRSGESIIRRPCTLTRSGPKCGSRRSCWPVRGAIDAPRRRSRFSVTSTSSTSATTMAPFSAVVAALDDHRVAVEDAGIDHRCRRRLRARSGRRGRSGCRAPQPWCSGRAAPRSGCRRRSGRTAADRPRRCPGRPARRAAPRRNRRGSRSAKTAALGAAPPHRRAALSSGNFTTSSARARCASRRIKPRSSSPLISRWMPDLDRRFSASFISSNDGATPVAASRWLMNISSSCCFFVSIAISPARILLRARNKP